MNINIILIKLKYLIKKIIYIYNLFDKNINNFLYYDIFY